MVDLDAVIAEGQTTGWVRHYYGDRDAPGYGTNTPFLCDSDRSAAARSYEDIVAQLDTGAVLARRTGCEQADSESTASLPLASRLPALPHGSVPPDGSTWQMVDAGACNRTFPDEVSFDRPSSLSYTGATDGDLLRDAHRYGAKWRMAAVTTDGDIVATTEWCSDPVPEASPHHAPESAPRTLSLCGCDHALPLAGMEE